MIRIRNLLDGIHRAAQILRYDRDNQRLLREYVALKKAGK
jgi:hypothetical protein